MSTLDFKYYTLGIMAASDTETAGSLTTFEAVLFTFVPELVLGSAEVLARSMVRLKRAVSVCFTLLSSDTNLSSIDVSFCKIRKLGSEIRALAVLIEGTSKAG